MQPTEQREQNRQALLERLCKARAETDKLV